MKPYKNSSGNSGISAYEIEKDSIVLKFKHDGAYLYTYGRPGKKDVEAMKKLAVQGKGLTTYVTKHVRDNYERKIA